MIKHLSNDQTFAQRGGRTGRRGGGMEGDPANTRVVVEINESFSKDPRSLADAGMGCVAWRVRVRRGEVRHADRPWRYSTGCYRRPVAISAINHRDPFPHPSPSPPPHLSLRIDIQIDVRSVRAHSRENGTCFSLRWFSHALAAKAQHGRFLLTCLLAFKRFKGRLRDSRRYPEIQDWRFLK